MPTKVLIGQVILDFIEDFDDRQMEIFKAVNTSTGAIAGYCMFQFPDEGEFPRSEAEHALRPHGHLLIAKGELPLWVPEEKFECSEESSLPSPDDEDDDEDDYDWLKEDEARDRCYDEEVDFYVDFVAVAPAYRRLGLGARLLRAALDIADARGAKMCLETTTMALPLYEKLGFKVVEEYKWKGYTKTWMAREPEGKPEVPCSAICEDNENQS